MPDSALAAISGDRDMTSPLWISLAATEMSSPSSYASSSPSSTICGEDLEFGRSSTPSPEPYGHALWVIYFPSHQSQVQRTPLQQCALSATVSTPMTNILSLQCCFPRPLHHQEQQDDVTPPSPAASFLPITISRATNPSRSSKTRSHVSLSNYSLGHQHRRLHKLHQFWKLHLDAMALADRDHIATQKPIHQFN